MSSVSNKWAYAWHVADNMEGSYSILAGLQFPFFSFETWSHNIALF